MSTEERTPPPQTQLREYALILPRLLRLLWRLARDPRVPARSKAVLVVLGGYLASPIDLIPDFIPAAGQLDDIVIVAVALDHMLNRVEPDIVREHWDGDTDVLEVVQQVLDLSTSFMPAWLRKRLPGSPTASPAYDLRNDREK